MQKKIIFTEVIKNSANLEKNKDKYPNWREDNPKKKSFIGGKPAKYKEMDKLFKQLEEILKKIDNYIKDIILDNNILKFSYVNGDNKEIDLSKYVDLHLKKLELDETNKKLIATLTDDSTIDLDISNIYDTIIKDISFTDNKLTFTFNDDSTKDIDLSDYLDNKNLKKLELDETNKKLIATLTDDSTIELDISSILDSIDNKVTKIDSTDLDIAIFDGINGELKNSNVSIDSNNSIIIKDGTIFAKDNIEISSNGSGDRDSFIDYHSDDNNSDYSARIIREKGENGNFNLINKGNGDININNLGDNGNINLNPKSGIILLMKDGNEYIKVNDTSITQTKGTQITTKSIEIGINADDGEDRNSWIDFHSSSDSSNDRDARIIREKGEDGNLVIENKGDGDINLGFINITPNAGGVNNRHRVNITSDENSELHIVAGEDKTPIIRFYDGDNQQYGLFANYPSDDFFSIYSYITSEHVFTINNSSNIKHRKGTQLGENAPTIQQKKLTLTTADSEGGEVYVAHGLDINNIISVDVVVYTDDYIVSKHHNDSSLGDGYEFDWYINNSYFHIKNHDTNSEHILSKNCKILITYEV